MPDARCVSNVEPVRLGDTVIDERAVREFLDYTFLYFIQVGVGAIMIELDAGRVGLHLTTLEVLSASLATLGNIGPGFGLLGPFGSYRQFPRPRNS